MALLVVDTGRRVKPANSVGGGSLDEDDQRPELSCAEELQSLGRRRERSRRKGVGRT